MSKCNLTRFLRVNRRRVSLGVLIVPSKSPGQLLTQPGVIQIYGKVACGAGGVYVPMTVYEEMVCWLEVGGLLHVTQTQK